ncbi:2'-5' RNA ligase family protein [Erythrobacter insulae]|uniref:2'-5' RNA ligase family protein n=1 Tax=Erythrobacter insulae TaxID=2584124 RepID=A0A547P8F9_9SPHN|nr:2'-5' RNA ligase family protein [Erythrobacter insulae]TRD10419.1 2'-5' RNA ligase family protein [Erythrobacter insulae]
MANPFILTAKLPPAIQGWADNLRRAHYPAERNHLHAHVTMFHSFAPSLLDELKDFLPRLTAEFASPDAEVSGIMDLHTGTAIALHSPQLLTLRELIAEHFHGSLTAQDLHEPRPHITIQNKVTKREARALQAELLPGLEPVRFAFPALELHLYKGGPWDLVKTSAFRGHERL